MKYNIYAGVSKEFGGKDYHFTSEFPNEEEAIRAAYETAIDCYESYEGIHDLKSFYDVALDLGYESDEDIEHNQEEIQNLYEDLRNERLEYEAIPTEEDDLNEKFLNIV